MLEAVKTPRINLSYDCDAAVIGQLVDFLKSRYGNLTITVMPFKEESVEHDDGEELVNIRDTGWWKRMDNVGTLILGTRLKHQMTQKQLSRLSGISHATISAYEHNRRPLSRLAAIRLAKAMGEDPASFLDRISPKP